MDFSYQSPEAGNHQPAEPAEPGRKIDLGRLLQPVLEKLWLVGLGLGLALLIGGVLAYRAVPEYEARATLQVEPEGRRVLAIEEVSSQSVRDYDVLNTLAETIRSRRVLARVVRTNRLAEAKGFLPGQTNAVGEGELVRALERMVHTRLRPSTRLIDVVVAHPDPEWAQRLANSVAREFIQDRQDQQLAVTVEANRDLVTQAEELRAKLQAAELKVQSYKETNQTVSLEERQNIVGDDLKRLSQSYAEAKATRMQLEAERGQITNRLAAPELLLELPTLAQDEQVVALRKRLVDQEVLVASLTNRYRPKYGKMIEARQQLAELRQSLNRLLMQGARQLESRYARAREEEKKFRQAREEAREEALRLSRMQIEFRALEREVSTYQALYEKVLSRIGETNVSQGIDKTAVTLAEAAVLPRVAARPNRKRMVLTAGLLGLLVPLFVVYLLDRIDSSLHTVDEAERRLGLPVLGAIPIDREARRRRRRAGVVEAPHSLCAEAFRTLRTSIELLGREEVRKVQLFTSAEPSEGKTFSSVNYAHSVAQLGREVLLIDFDLRRPSVGTAFGLETGAAGVTDYLLGRRRMAELVVGTKYEHLQVLPAGPKVPNPAEQLSGGYARALIEEAAREYEVVVLDTAPLNSVSDTFHLLAHAQMTALVVRAGRTSEKAIRRCLEMMRRAERTASCVVLNTLPDRSGYGYYYYHYYARDGYRSQGVYGADDRKPKGVVEKPEPATTSVSLG